MIIEIVVFLSGFAVFFTANLCALFHGFEVVQGTSTARVLVFYTSVRQRVVAISDFTALTMTGISRLGTEVGWILQVYVISFTCIYTTYRVFAYFTADTDPVFHTHVTYKSNLTTF